MSQAIVPAERGRAIATISLGFAADPVLRFLWPDAAAYLDAMPDFIAGYGGGAFDAGSADMLADGSAAALWLPPGVGSDRALLGVLMQRSVDPARLAELGAMTAEMRAAKPAGPLWYLTMLAADPASQGRGLGSALLRHGLARADAAGVPAYLEASSPRNEALYARHGFVALARPVMANGVSLVPMARPVGG